MEWHRLGQICVKAERTIGGNLSAANSIIELTTADTSFVDGDTFTAQPDGTCALFSEYKALYY